MALSGIFLPGFTIVTNSSATWPSMVLITAISHILSPETGSSPVVSTSKNAK